MTQSSTVIASDGVYLAVHAHTEIDQRRPTILAIHGYPDNHHVSNRVATSSVGATTRGLRRARDQRIVQARKALGIPLAATRSDIGAVIDSLGVDQVSPRGPRLGFDPGVGGSNRRAVMRRVASSTWIYGPHLKYAAGTSVPTHTPWRVRRPEAGAGVVVHLVLLVPGCAGVGDLDPGNRDSLCRG